MDSNKETFRRIVIVSSLERLQRDLRDMRLHGLSPAQTYSQRVDHALSCLPRFGAPEEFFLEAKDAFFLEAEACLDLADEICRGHNHGPRVLDKLKVLMTHQDNILLIGDNMKTSEVLNSLQKQDPPKGISQVVYIDASDLDENSKAHHLFAKVAASLGIESVELGDYEPLWYQQILNQIEALYPYPPFGSRRSDHPATYIVVHNCPPILAGFICCNLRDSLWQLPLHWLWTVAEDNKRSLLHMPGDFFDRQINLATGFESAPQYQR